ncbi:MAG: ornithine cyclodeaminase family protein [Alphaproteobacteria bacterium]
MTTAPIWITEAEVVSLIHLPDAVSALERILLMEGEGGAQNMAKAHLMVGANDAMHALGASVAGAGICGFKTWINVAGKSSTVLTLFSLEDGACLAVIEATALGQMRTASMTGVGTKRMAPEDADDMAIIGTGKQALTQVAACAAVRPLKRVRVFSRRPEARAAFAEAVRAQFDMEIVVADTLEDALKDAPIVTLITNATKPFVNASMLARGAHVNVMGAIVPARVEFTDDVFDRCDAIAVDNLVNIRELSAEFRARFGDDDAAWESVRPISELVAEGFTRPPGCDLTLFKAMGMGISDLALGIEILERARKAGGSHTLPDRVRTPPRLKAD